MRKMVFLQDLQKEHLTKVKALASEWDIITVDDSSDELQHLEKAEIICGWNPAAAEKCVRAGTRLKWVQTWGAGVDKLPLEEMGKCGIIVTSASGVHPHPISEMVLGMMLNFSRKIHLSIRHQLQHRWQIVEGLGEIHGKTIGIIGVGAIGKEIARLAKAFGMKVLGVRRSGQRTEYVDYMYAMSQLNHVLSKSDYVVVTLPLTNETRHMFGYEQFQMMKRSAYFINVGRGATVYTGALIDALIHGEIAGAGLDVFEQEPLPHDNPLWSMENVIMTPHNGGVTDQYVERVMQIFLINLESYLLGKQPTLNRVDPIRQY